MSVPAPALSNPLLAPAAPNALPAFDRIGPEHAEPALDAVLADDRLTRAWGPVQHLFGVKATADWRKAFNAGLPKITEYGIEQSQNELLFRAYEKLSQAPAFSTFSASRKKVVADALRDFKLSGIALPAEQKARFKTIAMQQARHRRSPAGRHDRRRQGPGGRESPGQGPQGLAADPGLPEL
jgi:oligopeptidase A